MGAGPLEGIKVVDLSRILAGPYASQKLGDMGATVWKVERPGTGDDTRAWPRSLVKWIRLNAMPVWSYGPKAS